MSRDNNREYVREILDLIEPEEGAGGRMYRNILQKTTTAQVFPSAVKRTVGRENKWVSVIISLVVVSLIAVIIAAGGRAANTGGSDGIAVSPGEEINGSQNTVSASEPSENTGSSADDGNMQSHEDSMQNGGHDNPDDTEGGQTIPGGSDIYGGDTTGGVNIPIDIFKDFDIIPIERVGEVLTDEEAREYFSTNLVGIANSLAASGVNADSLRVSEHGYCHINLSDNNNSVAPEIRRNFRDYLAYSGDELVAIITLAKEDGQIYSTPAFGGPWFSDYNEKLQNYKGQKLLYLYVGFIEVVIAPDNSYFCTGGADISSFMEAVENPYERLYAEEAIYIP